MNPSNKVAQEINEIIEKKLELGEVLHIKDVNEITNTVIAKNMSLFNTKPSETRYGCNIYSLPKLSQLIIDPQTGIVKGIKKN